MANPTVCPICGTVLPLEPLDDVVAICPKCAVSPEEPPLVVLPASSAVTPLPDRSSRDRSLPPRHTTGLVVATAPPPPPAPGDADSPFLWVLVQVGIVFCGLANIPALANTIMASTVVVQSMDDPTVLARYIEPSRPDPVESLVRAAISLLTILSLIGGCGLCCFAPARPAAHAAQLAFALVFVSLLGIVVAGVGFVSVVVDRTKPFVGYALALAVVSVCLAVAAEVYHVRFFQRLGTSLSAKRLEGTASFTLKTLFVALIASVAAGIAIYMYSMYASVQESQSRLGQSIMEMTPRQKPQVPDTTIPLLILAPLMVWLFFFLMYFKLLFSAFSTISARPRAPQPSLTG